MGESLVDSLREATAKGLERQKREVKAASRSESAARKREAVRRQQQVDEFVAENLPHEVESITKKAEAFANGGSSSIDKTWRIARGSNEPEPTEELAKVRGLRDEVARHFTELHFTVDEIDRREGREDRTYGSDEGYFPWVYTDHIIGVTLSWGEEEQSQDKN